MQQPVPPPLLTPRPRPPGRPPAQRTSSSRLTALPTPSTPRSAARRARERERRSLDALGLASELDEMTGSGASFGGRSSFGGVLESRESAGVDAGADARGSAEGLVGRDAVRAGTRSSRAPSPVSFPSTDQSPATADPFIVVKPSSGSSTPPSNPQTSPLAPVLAPAALGPDHLKSLSREELEKMLADADRVIREKEQELSVFTHAGEELLQEYHSLRQRHESLVARKPSASGSTTPFLSTSASIQPLPGASKPLAKSPARLRPSRESLGRHTPDSNRHSHRASGASSLHLHEQGSFASEPESPSHAYRRSSRISVLTPDDSPTSTRRRQFASVTPKSPAVRLGIPASLFSPATAARDVASLNQANYALSLQLCDLQADSEVAEREGRKRLRKLERELQALREDLERVEQRNVVLESRAEVAVSGNNELLRSIRRYDTMQSKIAAETGADVPLRPSLVSDDEDDLRASQSAPEDNLFTTQARGDEPLSPLPDSADKSQISPFRQPGHGSLFPLSFAHSIIRTASASSLVPLPAPIELDPSLEQQQDELVDQLMAKIDELQDVNEAILAERDDMVCRLDEVQEEVLEWKERCEELEEEIVQNRLVGWEGPIGAIEWRVEEDADAESEAGEPSSIRKTRTRPPTAKRSNTSSSVSTRLSGPTCTSSPVTIFAKLPSPPKRTLSNELGEEWATDTYERSDPFDDPSFSSVIDHGLRPDIRHSKLELATSAPSDDESDEGCPTPPFATTTADDLLHSGSLRYAGYPDAETYDELEKAAANLMPAWEDEHAMPSGKPRRRKALPSHMSAKGKSAEYREYERSTAGRSTAVVLYPDRIQSDEDDFEPPRSSRRWHALRRLQREASSMRGKLTSRRRPALDSSEAEYDSDDFESDISSDYDHLNHSLRRSSDYYPLSVRARYHPRMVVARMTDTVVQKIVSFVTWIRFLVILGMAIVFAVWQGPQKTLGIVDRRRRIL